MRGSRPCCSRALTDARAGTHPGGSGVGAWCGVALSKRYKGRLLLRDFLLDQGVSGISGSRDAVREAVVRGLCLGAPATAALAVAVLVGQGAVEREKHLGGTSAQASTDILGAKPFRWCRRKPRTLHQIWCTDRPFLLRLPGRTPGSSTLAAPAEAQPKPSFYAHRRISTSQKNTCGDVSVGMSPLACLNKHCGSAGEGQCAGGCAGRG